MRRSVVAYDLGRTTWRGALVVDGRRVAIAEEAAVAPVVDADGLAHVTDALARLSRRLDRQPLAGVALGLSGIVQVPPAATHLAQLLGRLHGAPRTVVVSDLTIAHAGALHGRPGVVVLAGTGSAALGVSPTGRAVQVDGWGHLLGDVGSGYSIGRAGLAAALARHDGRGAPTRLVEHTEDRFGPLARLPAVLHRAANPARLVASFADAVAVAARAGDEVARSIWSRAAAELARTAAAAVHRVAGDGADVERGVGVEVSWAGGLFTHADLLLAPLRSELERLALEAELVAPAGDPLDGGALLAAHADTCHEPLLHDTTRSQPAAMGTA